MKKKTKRGLKVLCYEIARRFSGRKKGHLGLCPSKKEGERDITAGIVGLGGVIIAPGVSKQRRDYGESKRQMPRAAGRKNRGTG